MSAWKRFAPPRVGLMGILNLTPDSFSDGGRFDTHDLALRRAAAMIAEGANILDIGAESTRPGATPISAEEELRRLAPLAEIVALGTPVSVDTTKASVARFALACGACIINDIWGLQRDLDLAYAVAEHDCDVIIMHNREIVDEKIDILDDILCFFEKSLQISARAGVKNEHICLDPGIGFGKTPAQSLNVLRRLERLTRLGLPLLVGASRKRFIDSVSPAPPEQRLGGSIAAHLLAVQRGASLVRVHDVKETAQALRVAAAVG